MGNERASSMQEKAGSFHSAPGALVSAAAGAFPHGPINGSVPRRAVVTIPILSLRAGETPRLGGEDKAHIAWLAETEAPLPPILVDRRTMRVIDGMHRLLAASLRGRETIDVEFFDGAPADAFLRAVEANVSHGLPLSQSDRQAAAERIVVSHPQMSDRAIGETAGLAARTVASIRRRSTVATPQLSARVGRDGKVRPLDGRAGRQRAVELLAERPEASLREVARAAGVSPATASDVRKRLARGEEPVLSRPDLRDPSRDLPGSPAASRPQPAGMARPGGGPIASVPILHKLIRDPSLRHNEQGRRLLSLLQHNSVSAQEWPGVSAAVPPHCAVLVVQLARQYAQMWLDFARDLDERARIIDPLDSRRVNDLT